MILISTRSSRFFVVLLHLLGVSTHLPGWSFHDTGIVGVHPLSIVLESSDPVQYDGDKYLQQPHWIQDTWDQTCLDPMGGFSECGDATLWLVIPKRKRYAEKRKQWIRWATEEEDDTQEETGYALQLVEGNPYTSQLSSSSSSEEHESNSPHYADVSQKECLTRRRKDNELALESCARERAWSWHFNEHGIMHYESIKATKRQRVKRETKSALECVGRNATSALLVGCRGEATEAEMGILHSYEKRVIQLALVRQSVTYHSTIPSEAPSTATTAERPTSFLSGRRRQPAETPSFVSQDPLPLPSQRAIAHSHASTSIDHLAEFKMPPRLTTLSSHPPKRDVGSGSPLFQVLLKDTNPILLAQSQNQKLNLERKSPTSILRADTDAPIGSMKPVSLIRKIQMNPYIAASEEERWTDPLTGLVYHTDLCQYLGHDRHESGRHTLTGIGHFMKTMLKIKVYGVGLYVSKRDILADPVMEEFAAMTAEELRQQPDFFQVLRKMTGTTTEKAGTFDRTIFLQTNMQLATETMRNSLDADWKMLTQEAKDLLIGSSMRPRPASKTMLKVISSSNNPSRCSCGQIAPDEYQADPECCARGTELVFTWRKNGDLEVRLNGDFMDTFARPDIAEGIFFEYLRTDDPMSFDFLDRVVDGFPMLLGPLAQVKGISSPAMSSPASSPKISPHHPVLRALEGVGGSLASSAHIVAGAVHNGASELTTNVVNTAKAMGDAAKNLGEEMGRRRDLIGKHMTQFAEKTVGSFYNSKDRKALIVLPTWLEDIGASKQVPSEEPKQTAPHGKVFRLALSRFFGGSDVTQAVATDEIVPMIHPPKHHSTQQLFFGIVHMYLLLLWIVSFPAPLKTRTKLVVSRKAAPARCDSENLSDSEFSADECQDSSPLEVGSPPATRASFKSTGSSHFLPKSEWKRQS